MATRDSSFAYSIDQAQRLFGKGLEVIGSRTGIETLFNYGKEIVAQQDKDIREGNYQPEYTMGLREAYRQGGLSDAVGWVAEKTGENLATSGIALGGGLASALTAPFSVPAAALIGGATILGSGVLGTGEVAEEMEQKTGSYNDSVAIGAGTLIALLDRFGAGRVIPREELLEITGKDLIKRLGEEGYVDAARAIGRNIGKSVAFEGGTEGLQEGIVVGSTALTGGEYTGEQVADRLLEGVVLGGTMGGGFRSAIEVAGRTPDAYAGIQTLVGDIFGSGGGMTPGMQVAMQTAATLSGPGFARFKMDAAPKTDAEILMNETAGKGGGQQLTVKDKVAKNIEITSDRDPEIDENQSFFNKDLDGFSVGNFKAQKEARREIKKIKEFADREAAKRLQDPGLSETDKQRIEIDRQTRIKQELAKAKNKERLQETEDPVVSPLRIKLAKYADQIGYTKPIKVKDLYDHLRSQDTNVEGSVGFLGKVEASTVEGEEIRYKPKDDLTPDQKKEFGQLIKNAPKIRTPLLDDNGNPLKDKKGNPRVKETPDFDAVPKIKELGVKISVPVYVKKLATKFDNESPNNQKTTHYKGGEAFTSGLEEYLARNYNETKTMREIIHQFDRMRPTVRLEVRSSMNRNLPPDQAPFTNRALAAGDFLTDPDFVLPPGTNNLPQGYSGQRIFNSFTIGNKPVVNESSLSIDRSAGDPKEYQFDKISIIAKNPDHERIMSGTLTDSLTLGTHQMKKDGGKTIMERADQRAAADRAKELGYPAGHDYYEKGFGYTRSLIVEGTDGKLYAVLEENQSDVTRTYENLLDFSKPEYDLALKYGGVPELLSGSIDLALKGNDPYLTKKQALLGSANFTDKRPVKNLSRTRDRLETHKLFTPSEKNKIDVLDDMDLNMPKDDAPSLYNIDNVAKKKKFDEAVKKLEVIDDEISKNQRFIDSFKLTERAPQELEKFSEIGLEDLIKFRKEAIPRMKKYFALRRRTDITDPQPLSNAEENTIIQSFIDRLGNTMEARAAAEAQIKKTQEERGAIPRKISFRQFEGVLNEKLNGLDEIVERTLFSERDYTDFADNLRESVDEDLFATEDFVSDIDSFIAQTTNPFELVSEGKLKFSSDPTFRNVPKVAKDSFGREIIRLFNEMAGFRDGVEADLKYVDTRTGAPSKAKFRDKYERFGDSSMPGTGTGFSIDGLVLPNKFMSGSKNQKRSFELGHRLNTPHRFEGFAGIFGAPRKDVESYEEGKDVFSTIIKHMPFASALSGENDKQYSQDRVPLREGESRSRMLRESDQQVISTTPLSADRTYQKNSVTYDMGRSEEDQKLTRINNNEYEADTRDRLKTDIQSILSQNSVYDFQDARDILGDNVVSTTPGQGFYGKASQEGNQDVVRDAVEKALNLAVSDATYEAINEKALDVIKHRVASELVRRHKDVFEQLDLVGIMESSLNENYQDQDSINLITDSLGFVTGNATQVNYEDVTQKIKDALPERVMKDAEKILSQEIDDVADKIGFVPEDGNYKRYMSFIDRQRAVDPKLIAKFAKKLGIDNPDKLKKKLLIDSIINRNMIEPTGSTRFGTPGAGAATTRQNIEASMNPLQRFMGMADRANADFFVIQKKLEPIGYENIDHTAGYGYSLKPDPTLGNFFQLFTTQAYRGFMQGDRERAEALEKEANALVYKRGEAKRQRDENEVADTDEAEIDRRYDKMKEYIDKNAEKYNYSPEELKEALQRVREHNDTRAPKKYIRAPHNANETQTARGLLHSLIHQVTDPRFEQLYGRKIEGVVLPHRTDLYLTRAIEDPRVRDPRTFGMGTYGSAIQTLLERFEAAGATVDRDRIFEMKNVKNPNAPTASLNRPVQGVIDLSEGSIGRKIAEGKFTFRAKGGYIDLRRKAS